MENIKMKIIFNGKRWSENVMSYFESNESYMPFLNLFTFKKSYTGLYGYFLDTPIYRDLNMDRQSRQSLIRSVMKMWGV